MRFLTADISALYANIRRLKNQCVPQHASNGCVLPSKCLPSSKWATRNCALRLDVTVSRPMRETSCCGAPFLHFRQ